MHVLVTGATGFVGGRLVPALMAAGHTVTSLVRDRTTYEPPAGVSVIEADLLDQATLTGVFEGVDAAYYLVHSLKSGPDFAARDRRAAENFVRASAETSLRRVIYLGGLGETGPDLSEHLRSRRDVEDVLASGKFDLTTLRAAIIIGRGSASFALLEQLAGRLPLMITPKWVKTPCQPIAIDDVVSYLVGVLASPATAGETYEIGGPDVLTYEGMMRKTAALMGRKPVIVPVPILSPRLSVYWIDLVTDIPKHIAHPLVYGLKNPVVATDDRIRELVSVEETAFEVAVERALEAGDGRTTTS